MGESIKRLIGNIRGPKGIDGKAFDLYNLGMYDEYADLGNGRVAIKRKTAIFYVSPNHAIYFSTGTNADGKKYSDYPYFIIGDGSAHFNIKHFKTAAEKCFCNTLPFKQNLEKNEDLIYTLSSDFQNTIVIRKPDCVVKNEDGSYNDSKSCEKLRTWLSIHPTYIYGLLKEVYWYDDYAAGTQPISFMPQQGEEWLYSEWRRGLNIFNPEKHLTASAEARGVYQIKNKAGAESVFANIPVTKGKTYTISMRGGFKKEDDPSVDNWLALGVQNGKDVPYVIDGEIVHANVVTDMYGNKSILTGVAADGIMSEVIHATFVAKSDWISLSSICTTIEHLMLVEGAILYPCEAYHGGVVREKEFNELKDRIAALEAKLAAATETEG
ncbi:MAG: hypothetical protein IJX30_00550 [Clostridia bacterium]|nr:hypothetical protein [Clostridia bacterium]MBQ8428576.1 hypothetical protein [Clostridia bacterium]